VMGDRSLELTKLQKELEEKLAQSGWPKEERDFSGHLTLCRIKSFKAARVVQDIASQYADVHLGSQFVDALCVYKSQLTPDGPVYTLLQKSELK
jgi:2'-5' RNA ligase